VEAAASQPPCGACARAREYLGDGLGLGELQPRLLQRLVQLAHVALRVARRRGRRGRLGVGARGGLGVHARLGGGERGGEGRGAAAVGRRGRELVDQPEAQR
jgi:hypothetical protein